MNKISLTSTFLLYSKKYCHHNCYLGWNEYSNIKKVKFHDEKNIDRNGCYQNREISVNPISIHCEQVNQINRMKHIYEGERFLYSIKISICLSLNNPLR